jgi:hypothetical protein
MQQALPLPAVPLPPGPSVFGGALSKFVSSGTLEESVFIDRNQQIFHGEFVHIFLRQIRDDTQQLEAALLPQGQAAAAPPPASPAPLTYDAAFPPLGAAQPKNQPRPQKGRIAPTMVATPAAADQRLQRCAALYARLLLSMQVPHTFDELHLVLRQLSLHTTDPSKAALSTQASGRVLLSRQEAVSFAISSLGKLAPLLSTLGTKVLKLLTENPTIRSAAPALLSSLSCD